MPGFVVQYLAASEARAVGARPPRGARSVAGERARQPEWPRRETIDESGAVFDVPDGLRTDDIVPKHAWRPSGLGYADGPSHTEGGPGHSVEDRDGGGGDKHIHLHWHNDAYDYSTNTYSTAQHLGESVAAVAAAAPIIAAQRNAAEVAAERDLWLAMMRNTLVRGEPMPSQERTPWLGIAIVAGIVIVTLALILSSAEPVNGREQIRAA